MRIAEQGQVSLEITIVFVAVLLFLLGMLRILFWGNNDLFLRQKDYDRTRDAQGRWPIHSSSNLSDDVIFRGRF